MNKTIKILLSYHKPDFLFKDNILTPIHAGRAIALKKAAPDDKDLIWLLENTIGDNTGDNISVKNATYNEMTSVYWAWKNYENLGSPEYIGFMHYRRHFIFSTKISDPVRECLDITNNYFEEINYREDILQSLVSDCDFLCVKPQWRESLYKHYEANHEIKDLNVAIEILKEKYPQFSLAADTYLSSHDAYFCNMFIFPKEIFFEYASWLFSILFELEKRIDFTNKRMFVSEWLTGIFITYLKQKGKKGKFLPMMIAEGEHEIPIIIAADNGYAYPMIVTIASALQTAKANTTYIFYLLVSNDFSDTNRQMIKQICSEYPKCRYYFFNMGNAYKNVHLTIKHITKATYYRLLLPSLLPNVSKCIYLDADIIVKKDLSLLYRTCIDDKYIAGVRALGYFHSEENLQNKISELHIPSMDQYVNAGVLLMNLKKMRDDNLENTFENLLTKNFSSQDQDIINAACYGKIRLLPFQFNAMTKYPLYSDVAYDNTRYFQQYIKKNDWDNGRKNPTIIHYADKKKPWNDLSSLYAADWWSVALELPSNITKTISKYYLSTLTDTAHNLEEARMLAVAHKRDALESLNSTRQNIFYKFYRIISYIPSKSYGLYKCSRQHGISYTLKLVKKKITK